MNAPTHRLITSRGEFHDALRSAFAEAAAAGAREIWLCDANFADWPLSERAVIENLTRWINSGRRLTVLAQTFDEVVRRHSHWAEWRRQWSHVVQCRTETELEVADFPTICLVADVISVRLVDPVHYRGLASHEGADAKICREAIDAVLQRSIETFPVTTLGL
ncbi:MAG TPA: hypothetical protein VF308_07155 [Caldimonas sp.]